jgi:hypothetical protein
VAATIVGEYAISSGVAMIGRIATGGTARNITAPSVG